MTIQNSEIEDTPSKFTSLLSRLWPFGNKIKPVYNIRTVRLPKTSGRMLKILSVLIRIPGIRNLIFPIMLRQIGISSFRKCQTEDEPTFQPVLAFSDQLTQTEADESLKIFSSFDQKKAAITIKEASQLKPSLYHPETIADFHKAYVEKTTTPVDVALRLIDVIRSVEESAVPLKPLIAWDEKELMKQANESAKRFENGETLGMLDGVPIAVKDELDMHPFPTMIGTKLENIPPAKDATIVSRMRADGAMMIGKTNMHEIGAGVTGQNTHYGTTRNPYHLDHYPGGSSSGSAAAVAAGLCPVALAVDGGGSIRIPAALCGAIGLKSTWGRSSTVGSAPLSWSVGTVGPIASTVDDCALAYSIMAGPDPKQLLTCKQPPLDLNKYHDSNLEGIKIGYFKAWNQHSSTDIQQKCEKTMQDFKAQGAELCEIEIPELQEAFTALLVTISTEMVTSMQPHLKYFNSTFGLEVFVNLILASQLKGTDYVKAQRIRTRLILNLQRIFKNVDAILSPATAITAPRINPDALLDGEMDFKSFTELTRYAMFANLSGFPAISFPTGYDAQGLPIGMQLMARPWEESMLLRLVKAQERYFSRQPPMMRFSLLPDGKDEN